MNLVDSSGWLEYFAGGKNADFFSKGLLDTEKLIVPSICIYEVFKVVVHQKGEDAALQAVTLMLQGQVAEFNTPLSLNAAKLSLDLKLPMANSIILATARQYKATIWTQDSDFKDLGNVKYCSKRA